MSTESQNDKREIVFEIDTSPGVLELGTADEELEQLLFRKKLSNITMTATILQKSYGLWQNKQACRVICEFQFLAGVQSPFYFRSITITASYTPRMAAGGVNGTLSVAAYGPRNVPGKAVSDKHTDRQSIAVPITVGAGPVSGGITPKVSSTSEYTRQHRRIIKGECSAGRDSSRKNVITWSLKENKLQKMDIPGELVTGAVITYSSAFDLRLDIKPELNYPGFGPLKLRKSGDKSPMFFEPPVKTSTSEDFSKMTEDDWKKMLPLLEEDEYVATWSASSMSTAANRAWSQDLLLPNQLKDEKPRMKLSKSRNKDI